MLKVLATIGLSAVAADDSDGELNYRYARVLVSHVALDSDLIYDDFFLEVERLCEENPIWQCLQVESMPNSEWNGIIRIKIPLVQDFKVYHGEAGFSFLDIITDLPWVKEAYWPSVGTPRQGLHLDKAADTKAFRKMALMEKRIREAAKEFEAEAHATDL